MQGGAYPQTPPPGYTQTGMTSFYVCSVCYLVSFHSVSPPQVPPAPQSYPGTQSVVGYLILYTGYFHATILSRISQIREILFTNYCCCS